MQEVNDRAHQMSITTTKVWTNSGLGHGRSLTARVHLKHGMPVTIFLVGLGREMARVQHHFSFHPSDGPPCGRRLALHGHCVGPY